MGEWQIRHAAGIEYAEAAPANKQAETIIFMHGIGGDHASFASQLEALSDEFRVLSWNMPGYRNSTPLADCTFADLTECLVAFMDELGLQKAHIAGQSIGGMLAMELAVRAPQRVHSLVLIATTSAFGGRDDTFRDDFLAARLKPIEQGETMPALAARFVPEIIGNNATAEAVRSAIASMAAVPVATYKAILGCLVTFNRRDDIASIGHRVCLIAGSEDRNAPARTMKKMAGVFPQAEYHNIDGAGHLVNHEQPETCNAIIRRFLQQQP